MTTPQLSDAVAAVRDLLAQVHVIEIDEALAEHAGALAERHALRGYDATHLAAALTLQALGPQPVICATWDRRLHQAAFDAGLVVAPALI